MTTYEIARTIARQHVDADMAVLAEGACLDSEQPIGYMTGTASLFDDIEALGVEPPSDLAFQEIADLIPKIYCEIRDEKAERT